MNFVFDIDGTLCFDGRTIERSIVEALDRLVDHGHQVIFASARPIRDLMPVIPPQYRQGKLIGGNGCYTSEHGEIQTAYFPQPVLEQLLAIIQTYSITYLADGKWDYAYTGSTDHPIYRNINQSSAEQVDLAALNPICKMVLFDPNEQVLASLEQLPVTLTTYQKENAIDISPLGIDKAAGLKALKVSEYIAFGNDSNDRCLFKKALYSVCVGDHDVHHDASIRISKKQVAATILQLSQQQDWITSRSTG